MAIRKMKLVRISGPSSELDKVISVCCSFGAFHPENAESFVSDTMGYESVNIESPYTSLLQDLRELAVSYDFSLESEDKSKKVEIDDKTSLYVKETASKLGALGQNVKELEEQQKQCEDAITKYSHFMGLGLDFKEIFDCKFIRFRFGRIPKDSYQKLIKGYEDNPYILFYPCSSDDVGYWGAYFAPSDKVGQVDRIFAALQFERLQIPKAVGTAEEIVENFKKNVEIIELEKKRIDGEIHSVIDGSAEKFRAIYNKLSDLNTIFEAKRYAVFNRKNCFFVGWIPAVHEELLKEKLANFTKFTVDFESPSKSSKVQPPTKLKNPIFFRPFEYFVEMYGLPSYNEMDVTAFVAITYTIIFGIMFGDLGQGLIVFLVGLIMYKKSGSGLGKILIPCGLSSSFFGLMFGSVFGFEEMLNPVYTAIGMKGKPLSVMDSINTVLFISIFIGVGLVLVAMILATVMNIKKHKFGSALFSENGLTGICVYSGAVSLAYHFMKPEAYLLPSGLSAAMVGIGLLILYNKEILATSIDKGKFHKPESWSDYFMQNVFEVIEYVLSYFSNTVSFLRVGAFVIVHASMMMVFFTLAGNPESLSDLSVGGAVIIVLGNILVIALEGLLSGIQGLRLEFYEMFSRFFEGEGKPFNPLALASKRVKN